MGLATKWFSKASTGRAREARARGGTVLIALLSVWGAAVLYQIAEGERVTDPDPYQIGMQSERFQAVAARVPAGDVLGYTSDQALDSTAGQAMFFGAQYALAPRLLTEDSVRGNPRYVLGNFSKQVDPAAWAGTLGLRVTAELGSGVVLFERERK